MATINKIYYNGDAYGIESSGLVTTQPANPTEGAMYYDTTNDVVKFYDGTNWIALGSGSGDVVGPGSSVDGHLAVFDGTTGKAIKDGGAVPTVPTKVSDLTNDAGYLTSSTGVTSVNGSHGAVTINEPKVSSTAPSSPTEGMIWYDTTNDKLKTYNGSSWDEAGSGGGGDATIKAFYIGSNMDLVTAQSAYDWYMAGKTPIVIYNDTAYLVSEKTNSYLSLGCAGNVYVDESTSDSTIQTFYIYLRTTSGTVTSIQYSEVTQGYGYLETGVDYSTPYTPEYDGSPATKKYVDDGDTVVSGDSGTTYTIKVSNSAPASGTPNTTITFVV